MFCFQTGRGAGVSWVAPLLWDPLREHTGLWKHSEKYTFRYLLKSKMSKMSYFMPKNGVSKRNIINMRITPKSGCRPNSTKNTDCRLVWSKNNKTFKRQLTPKLTNVMKMTAEYHKDANDNFGKPRRENKTVRLALSFRRSFQQFSQKDETKRRTEFVASGQVYRVVVNSFIFYSFLFLMSSSRHISQACMIFQKAWLELYCTHI